MQKKDPKEKRSKVEKAVKLTKKIPNLPSKIQLFFIFFLTIFSIGVVARIFLNLKNGTSGGLTNAGFAAILVAFLPFILMSFMSKGLLRKIPIKRFMLISGISSIIYLISYLSEMIFPNGYYTILLAYGFNFVFWYSVIKYVFNMKYSAIILAIAQTLIFAFFLFFANYLFFENFSNVAIRATASILTFILAFYAFVYVVNAPMEKNFGFRSSDAISMFFSQWFNQNKDFETFLCEIGEEVQTLVGYIVLKGKKTIAIVVPYVHFGPFGNLGGSEFSYLISKELEKRLGIESLVLHGPVTHDLDPVKSKDVKKLIYPLEKKWRAIKYTDANISIKIGNEKNTKCHYIDFNENALFGFSNAPETTEDMNAGVGLSLMNLCKKKNVLIFDEHNSETGIIKYVEPLTDLYWQYEQAMKNAMKKKGEKYNKIGFAKKQIKLNAIGKAGIKLLLFANGKNAMCWLYLDSNGIRPNTREKLIKAIKQEMKKQEFRKCEAEVITTDTHEVNIKGGVINPITDKEYAIIKMELGEMIKTAKANMEKKKVGFHIEKIRLKVLGSNQAMELISTVNSISSISKISFLLAILSASLLIFLLINIF